MITTTVDVYEAIWTAAALPGLAYWLVDTRKARRDLRAARTIDPPDGRVLWARFSVYLTHTFVGIEVLFVVLGLVAMTRPAPPVGEPLLRVVSVCGLIAASAVIAHLGYRWQRVNRSIVDLAREHQAALLREGRRRDG